MQSWKHLVLGFKTLEFTENLISKFSLNFFKRIFRRTKLVVSIKPRPSVQANTEQMAIFFAQGLSTKTKSLPFCVAAEHRSSRIVWHVSQTRTGLAEEGSFIVLSEHALQNIPPQFRQWCLRRDTLIMVKSRFRKRRKNDVLMKQGQEKFTFLGKGDLRNSIQAQSNGMDPPKWFFAADARRCFFVGRPGSVLQHQLGLAQILHFQARFA